MVEYATPVWSPYTLQSITLVEDVQRSFTRRLPGLLEFSYADRLKILGIQTLEHRRLLTDLVLCFKITHGLIALNFDDFFKFSPNSAFRGHPFKLAVPISRCNRSKYFFSSRIVPVWNCLPAEVVMTKSIASFKTEIRKLDLSRFLILPCIIF